MQVRANEFVVFERNDFTQGRAACRSMEDKTHTKAYLEVLGDFNIVMQPDAGSKYCNGLMANQCGNNHFGSQQHPQYESKRFNRSPRKPTLPPRPPEHPTRNPRGRNAPSPDPNHRQNPYLCETPLGTL